MRQIFIAEADAPSRELLTDALEHWGYRVSSFENGADLLRGLGAEVPDAFILDVHMPVLDGLETLTRLREILKPMPPALALTESLMNSERERILAAGFNQYATKPISLASLRAMVEALWLEPRSGTP